MSLPLICIKKHIEMASLITMGFIFGALWLLIELSDEVAEGDTQGFDRRILLLLRTPGDLSDPIGPWWLEEMGRDVTALGGVAVLTMATLCSAIYFLLLRRWGNLLCIVATVGGGILISNYAKDIFDRARPDLVSHGSLVNSASYPSGHTMMATILYLTLGVLIARMQTRSDLKILTLTIAMLLTLIVGISRVYMGVHWPTDVVAGWLAGAAWATTFLIIASWLESSGPVEKTKSKK